MQASKLISSSIISLHPDDDGLKALSVMDDLRVSHLPVIRNNFYLGLVSELSRLVPYYDLTAKNLKKKKESGLKSK